MLVASGHEQIDFCLKLIGSGILSHSPDFQYLVITSVPDHVMHKGCMFVIIIYSTNSLHKAILYEKFALSYNV